jgi:rod shape-determining protein MreD
VKRALLTVVLLAAVLLVQLTFVNRLPLPGAGAPDLVLIVVAALGLCNSPAVGAVTGFAAGLGLDIAPPGSYLIGEYALVLCLVGYLCGRLRGVLSRSALLTIAAAMAVAAAGEGLLAAVGLAVSDPQVTWPAVRQVLPTSIIYDVALTPFLLYLVMRAVRWADNLGTRGVAAGQPADGSALLARTAGGRALPGAAMGTATVLGGAGLLGGAGWLAGPVGARGPRGSRGGRGGARARTASTPRLRPAAARSGDGWVGGAPRTRLPGPQRLHPSRPGRPPRLRPGSGSAGSAVARPPRTLPRSPAKLRMGTASRRGGNLGRALGAGLGGGSASPALRRRPASGPPGSAFRGQRNVAGKPAAAARSGALSPGPRFRPDPRMRGGSSSPGVSMPRVASARRVSLRLGSTRRHDGVVGGGVLSSRGPHRRLAARPVSLRLGSGRGRRGDSALGALSGNHRFLGRPRQATPKFRSSPAIGGHSVLGRRSPLRAGKRVRFTSGRSWFLTPWAGGRRGGRSTVWRIGSKRTGGLR